MINLYYLNYLGLIGTFLLEITIDLPTVTGLLLAFSFMINIAYMESKDEVQDKNAPKGDDNGN